MATRVTKGPQTDIIQALTDPNLLGAALGPPETWERWFAVLKAAFALPMTDQDRALFAEVAGGRTPPTRRVDEFWAIVGRQSGKTRMAAACAVFIAAIEQHRLVPGQVGHVLLIAATKDQAETAFGYVLGFLQSSPILRQLIEGIQASEVRLKGNICISVHAGSYRSIRGRTLLGIIGDECAFWRDQDSAQPDIEIYNACLPALAASGGLWIGISTGYRKIGLLYKTWKESFAQNDDGVLVVQGSAPQFYSIFDDAFIARGIKSLGQDSAEAELLGGWRSDIASFLDDQTIDAVIEHSRPLEVPPRQGINYSCFVDTSGGRHDHFTICVGHREGSENHFFVCDVIRGRAPPFDPHEVVSEYAQLCREYRITTVTGDQYAADWVTTAFEKAGIRYANTEQNKSELYLEALPQFAREAISIPDHPKLIRELRLLERHSSRQGRDAVDHPKNGSDDYANALCGALRLLAGSSYDTSYKWVDGDDSNDPDGRDAWRMANFMNHIRRYG